jgi:L-rhamnose 1-dehydrogenase
MSLEGKTVVITGAARGIGEGIAVCFARKGAKIVIADLSLESAAETAARMGGHGAQDAWAVACDVSNRAEVESMIEKVWSRNGAIDVFVNNAGICPFIDVMEMTPEVWHKTIDVNLNGAFHCTQLAAKRMIERGKGGRFIYITSLAEHVTGPAQVDYAASKSGLRGVMFGFATALGKHGITCNAVAPGMIMTPMTSHHWSKPENAEFLRDRVPVGRIGTPEDIGNACVFLASDEAEYVNGITLRVDGGHQSVCR